MTAPTYAATATDVDALTRLVSGGGVVVLSGAGLSTESGIPDYRGPTGSVSRHAPMTYQAFLRDPAARRRYWARSHLGWQHFARAEPNAGHRAVAALERAALVTGTITQNVDGLHQAGGSVDVIDLHGRLDRVVCLDCRVTSSRAALNERLAQVNSSWRATVTRLNPDGDVDLPDEELDGFDVVGCDACGGVLKPDVVYFGENVPVDRVAASIDRVERASVLLVLGSSLTVFSGRRFVVRAARNGAPIAIVNDGPTRCDDLAAVRINGRLGPTLRQVQAALG
jgi:NAD-dependent SIR2 family protein deacetylase